MKDKELSHGHAEFAMSINTQVEMDIHSGLCIAGV